MYTKAQYQQLHDPEMALFWGIEEDITQLQIKGVSEITYNPRNIVPKKVYDELRKLPWDFTVTVDDSGLNSDVTGITKISWV